METEARFWAVVPVLATTDVESTAKFYRDVLQFAVDDRFFGPDWAMLRADQCQLFLSLNPAVAKTAAGQQISIVGGTDGDCVLVRSSACVPQTWVKLPDGQSLNYDGWTEGIRAGRTSISDGCYQFLDIEAQGLGVGDHLYVNTLGGSTVDVPVTVRFHLADGTRANESLEIVHEFRPGRAVMHLEFSPRGEQVWISLRDEDRVEVYDTGSFERLSALPMDKPSGIFLTARANRIGL